MLASQVQLSYSCTKIHILVSIHTWHFLISLFVFCAIMAIIHALDNILYDSDPASPDLHLFRCRKLRLLPLNHLALES